MCWIANWLYLILNDRYIKKIKKNITNIYQENYKQANIVKKITCNAFNIQNITTRWFGSFLVQRKLAFCFGFSFLFFLLFFKRYKRNTGRWFVLQKSSITKSLLLESSESVTSQTFEKSLIKFFYDYLLKIIAFERIQCLVIYNKHILKQQKLWSCIFCVCLFKFQQIYK